MFGVKTAFRLVSLPSPPLSQNPLAISRLKFWQSIALLKSPRLGKSIAKIAISFSLPKLVSNFFGNHNAQVVVVHSSFVIAEILKSNAKIAIHSLRRFVSHFLDNFKKKLVVVYGLFKITETSKSMPTLSYAFPSTDVSPNSLAILRHRLWQPIVLLKSPRDPGFFSFVQKFRT